MKVCSLCLLVRCANAPAPIRLIFRGLMAGGGRDRPGTGVLVALQCFLQCSLPNTTECEPKQSDISWSRNQGIPSTTGYCNLVMNRGNISTIDVARHAISVTSPDEMGRPSITSIDRGVFRGEVGIE